MKYTFSQVAALVVVPPWLASWLSGVMLVPWWAATMASVAVMLTMVALSVWINGWVDTRGDDST